MVHRQENQIESINNSTRIFKPGSMNLVAVSTAIIFIAETVVMIIIYFLDLHDLIYIGIVDSILLSIFVVPTLFYILLKPMRETISRLDRSESIQKQLEEVDQLKSDLISIASHELCTPVATIRGYTEMLLDDLDSENRQEYLELILRKSLSLERIIDDLGTVDRLDQGESFVITKAAHDLLGTIRNVCEIYRKRFPDIHIQLDIPNDPVVLKYDEIRFCQVMDNLLSNAVKYSKGLRDEIEVSVINQAAQTLLIIKDNGIGMTEDEVKKIYNKYFRAESEKPIAEGLGLGMAIVKNIVENHDAKIEIASQKNVGTTVTITIPK